MWRASCAVIAARHARNALTPGDSIELRDALLGIRLVASQMERVPCWTTRSIPADLVLTVAITRRVEHKGIPKSTNIRVGLRPVAFGQCFAELVPTETRASIQFAERILRGAQRWDKQDDKNETTHVQDRRQEVVTASSRYWTPQVDR